MQVFVIYSDEEAANTAMPQPSLIDELQKLTSPGKSSKVRYSYAQTFAIPQVNCKTNLWENHLIFYGVIFMGHVQ